MIQTLKNYYIYLLIFLSLIIFSTINFFVKKRKITILMLIIFFIFYSLIGSFRANFVGLDTLGYSNTYYSTKEGYNLFSFAFSQKPEIGYYGLVYLFSNVLHLPEPVFRFFTYSMISCFLLFAFYKEESCFFKLSLFLFVGFFIMSFSGIRQAISISILTFGINLLLKKFDKKNTFLYLALVIFATLFHKSSIIFCILPLLFLIKVKRSNFVFLLLIIVFVPSIVSSIIVFLSQYFYIHYQNADKTISITMILTIFLLVVYYLIHTVEPVKRLVNKIPFYKTKEVDGEYFNKVFWVVFLFIVFTSCNVFSTVIPRFAMYCYLGIPLFIYLYIDEITDNKMRFVVEIVSLLIFGLYFLYTLKSLQLVPYGVL